MSLRRVQQKIQAVPSSDGAGVRILRSLGQSRGLYADPFLLLDELGSDNAADYGGGFPAHPHRGFETFTYLLEGQLEHKDHLGNQGCLGPGDAQWMTAGKGIIHSEMPTHSQGRLHGFQLWINLPAAEKGQIASYRDIKASQVPRYKIAKARIEPLMGTITVFDQGEARQLAGVLQHQGHSQFSFAMLSLAANSQVELPLAAELCCMVYVVEGLANIAGKHVERSQLAVLGPGDVLRLSAVDTELCLLLMTAKPIGEDVVQYGPFVMNSREEIEQALADYREGNFC